MISTAIEISPKNSDKHWLRFIGTGELSASETKILEITQNTPEKILTIFEQFFNLNCLKYASNLINSIKIFSIWVICISLAFYMGWLPCGGINHSVMKSLNIKIHPLNFTRLQKIKTQSYGTDLKMKIKVRVICFCF